MRVKKTDRFAGCPHCLRLNVVPDGVWVYLCGHCHKRVDGTPDPFGARAAWQKVKDARTPPATIRGGVETIQ